ncbi:DUF1592 domain-containing protein, partial [Verrucomicrobiales bacterium]|nr:DUF1592 domain-containing protein [Verrucomicrobiales bacterium]
DLERLISSYCFDCHDSTVQRGGLNTELLLDGKISEHANDWERIVRQLQAGQMPPIGKERPTASEYQAMVSTLVSRLDANAAAHPNPGRTESIRRLTRTEYANAVRDLLGVSVEVKQLLPADSSSHGFDNVTVGDLSPALLERYIAAAQKVSRIALGIRSGGVDARTIRIPADLTQEDQLPELPAGTRGGAVVSHLFPEAGEYEIQVHLTRDRNESVEGLTRAHQIEIFIDGEREGGIKVSPPKNRRDHTLVDAKLKTRFAAAAGEAKVGVTFVDESSSLLETLRQPYEAHFNFHRHPRQSPAIFQVTITGPYSNEERSFEKGIQKLSAEKAKERLHRWMRLAYRRSLRAEDIARLDRVFENAMENAEPEVAVEAGLEMGLSAILVSRDFLFRVEREPEMASPGSPYSISPGVMASRLSFFLWSSLPDLTLLELAENGELLKPAVLRSQVARMLKDVRSDSLVTNFADQWLYLRNLDSITPDGRLFPGFDDNLRQAFRNETEWHFRRMLEENRSVLDLLRSEETWVNERLAKHYEIPHVYGTRFREVALGDASPRGGLLRQGSLLTVTSYGNRTSPVIRGNWILENLLGTPPPPPPPNTPALEDNTVAANLPIREKLAAHREQAACASCHNVMDPIGFPLENFDAVGAWRTREGSTVIDSTGNLPGREAFSGAAGLEKAILDRPEAFVRTLTEKLLTFALGRGVEPSDAPAIRQIVRAGATEDYRFRTLIESLVLSDLFTMRNSD